MRQKDKFDRDALHFAPFVLFPSPFPNDEYYKAINLQTVLNELMHKVGRGYHLVRETVNFSIMEIL